MGEMIFRPVIEDMTWSYSRIKAFEECPYGFFMKYIHYPRVREEELFYASYGKFIHKILEMFYKGLIYKDDLVIEFLSGFESNVLGPRPSTSIVNGYIKSGISYFKNFKPLPFNTVAVEEKADYSIGNLRVTGIIDYIGELDGEYYIVDHKSRNLKPRSGRKKPTLKDMELDDMLRQLYIYSAYVLQRYGKFPKALYFNCFRENILLKEDFCADKYSEAISWAEKTVEDIKNEEDFDPNIEYFRCKYLCGLHHECLYAEDLLKNRRK